MRILIGNDDGLQSPGLALLAAAAQALASDIWTVVPDRKWTAASHRISFDCDLVLGRVAERVYECSGAPADCVIAAMTILFAEGPKPDLVLAGVNDKRNVAEDIAYSGTMAVAREATFFGVPAIALSRATRWPDAPDEIAALRRLLTALWESRADWAASGHWLNIVLPDRLPAPIVQARVGNDKIAERCDVVDRSDDRIVFRLRRGRPGTTTRGDENAAVDAGSIALVRHAWHCEAPVSELLVEHWNRAIGDDEAVA
ncbi:MAG TPA: 5'/3'-nucleotidase SurE [Casimicrobiaceae bacterium]|jgi:5'-nucleotidase